MPKHLVDLLVLGSNQTITVPSEPESGDLLGVIDDGGVAVKNGRIVKAAASSFLERHYRGKKRLRSDGRTILPGLVDPHTHLVFAGSREDEFVGRVTGGDYLRTLHGGGGIMETVRRTRQASVEELYRAGYDRVTIALTKGTTTIEVKTGYGLNLECEQKILKVIERIRRTHPSNIIPTFLGAHAIPDDHPKADDYVTQLVEEILPSISKMGIARFCDVFCEKGVFDAERSLKILRAGLKHGIRSKIHADEFTNSGGTHLANQVGAASADHLVHSEERELARMVETGVTPVLLPGSSHSLLMEDFAQARRMLEMGLPVALGTDYSPANLMLSQLTVATHAARDLRMKPEEIIRGVTTNAAKALQVSSTRGSLAPGYYADLVLLDVPNYKWVGYSYDDALVDKVLIRGRQVVDRGIASW